MLDEIRAESEAWEDLNPHRLYQGHVANREAAKVAFLLSVVDVLRDALKEAGVDHA